MKIVTGYRGEPHITSQDHQSFYQGVFGRQMYVLGTGNEFEAQLTDTNTITVSDGDGIMQGCHFRIDLGEEENIVMHPGSSGMYRNDLLVARYTKDAATGVEDVSLVTITGTPSEGTPTVPSYNTGEIVNGETVDFPLYRVHFSGFTIDDIVPLFFIMPSLEAVYQSHEALADIVDGLLSWKFAGSAYGSTLVTMPVAAIHEIGVVTKLTVTGSSPVYLSEMTAVFRALYERLTFQNLTYNKENYCCNAHMIPVLLIMTSNAPDTYYTQLLGNYRKTLNLLVGPTEILVSGDTLQLKDYSKLDWPWTIFDP